MEKKLFTMMLMLLMMTAVGVTGCSNDDTPVEQVPEKEEGGESEGKDSIVVDTVEVFTPSPAVNNGEPISVSYRTLNADGVETSEFKEGENVILDLTIYNNTVEDILAGEMHDFLYSAFLVYSSNGKYVGRAYDASPMIYLKQVLEPGETYNWRYPWMLYPAASSRLPFEKWYERSPLPVGDYYSVFKLHLDNFEAQTYKAEFSVR